MLKYASKKILKTAIRAEQNDMAIEQHVAQKKMDEFFQFYFQRSDMPLLSHNAILEKHTTQIKSSMVSLFYHSQKKIVFT